MEREREKDGLILNEGVDERPLPFGKRGDTRLRLRKNKSK